jgi:threonylcarbamoyladenosine tRNA methylthiotransferase CDKAL1
MRVFIETYGCTLNQADSEILAGVLAETGVELCKSPDEADVIVLNTCFVKRQTQQRIIDRLKKLRGKRVVVAGCMPSANRWMVEKVAPEASMLGPYSLSNIYDAVLSAHEGKRSTFLDAKSEDKYSLPRVREGVIARIPISEGCGSCCSFCVTKLARPVLHSYDESSIIGEIKKCIRAGFSEIRLTSMDTGAYGLERKTDLSSLLRKIDKLDGKFLTRVGMINPEHVRRMLPDLIEAFKSEKIYKFLHVPLQSADEEVLRDMNRKYSVDEFMCVIEEFRREFPELTLATDIIVGFPTESEEAFNRTREFIKELKPDVVNNSKFFTRPGTKAAEMRQLPGRVVAERGRVMSALCRDIALRKNRLLIGKEFEVLLTERTCNGLAGRTHSYKQVIVQRGQLGDFVNARISDATACCLKG